MKLFQFFLIALRSLQSNKLRSTLTMLGMIIGVGAVITLMSVGRGAQTSILSTYESLGTNTLYVMPSSPEVAGLAGMATSYSTVSLTMDDVRLIERIDLIEAVAPVNENFIQVNYGSEDKVSLIHGATPDYLNVYGYEIAEGHFISAANVTSRNMVIVIGSDIADSLFPHRNPVGEIVKVKGQRFTIIGVLEKKGGAMMGVSMDSVVVVPITTYESRLFTQSASSGSEAIQSIAVRVKDPLQVDAARAEIEFTLRKSHRLTGADKNDFSLISQEQMVSIVSQVTGIFTIFLGSIAGISLVVGSIGIMNIMLVSVTERTREIGIRKAVGAKRRDILLQFLLEAATLSFTGGAIGLIGGWLLALAISQIDISGIKLAAVVSPDIIILALSVSIFIGLISGIYPAMRAARLNPIDALHYE